MSPSVVDALKLGTLSPRCKLIKNKCLGLPCAGWLIK
jgi:hypothetical protein